MTINNINSIPKQHKVLPALLSKFNDKVEFITVSLLDYQILRDLSLDRCELG